MLYYSPVHVAESTTWSRDHNNSTLYSTVCTQLTLSWNFLLLGRQQPEN